MNIFIRRAFSLVKCFLFRCFGQRGAELIEYALVLACIVAVGTYSFVSYKGTRGAYYWVKTGEIWEIISKALISVTSRG